MLFEVSAAVKGQTHGSLFSIFTDCSFIQTSGSFISRYFLHPLLQDLGFHHSRGQRRQSRNYHQQILSGRCLHSHSYFPGSYKCVGLPLTFPRLRELQRRNSQWPVIFLLRSITCKTFKLRYPDHKRIRSQSNAPRSFLEILGCCLYVFFFEWYETLVGSYFFAEISRARKFYLMQHKFMTGLVIILLNKEVYWK